ncbi:MAG: hypothetical protein ACRCYQ_08070 [Nocardioides sp.]
MKPPADDRGWAPPPRVLVATGVGVLGVCATLAVLGAFRTGITTDEPIHVMRLRNFLDTGWYALDWDYRGGGPGADGTNTYVYAPVTMLLLHAWSVLWGVEGWGEVATSPRAYEVRHLGVVLIGAAGVAAVAALGRVISRHWGWGVVAAATLAAVPMWTGHVMFNVKDVPVATGYTLVTLGLVLFVRGERPGHRLRLARAGSLAAGLVLALGTRPGMWTGVAVALATAGIGMLFAARAASRRASGEPARTRARSVAVPATAELIGAVAVAAIALVIIYPRLFGSPLRALPRTAESSSSFLDGLTSDRLYVPRHVLQEMPSVLLAFALTGALVAGVRLWRDRGDDVPAPTAGVALILVQAFALPVLAMVAGSDLYHGLRQLLFAAPAAAVLAAAGMAWWSTRGRDGSGWRARWLTRWVPPFAVLGLVLPVIDQVTLHPYQTTYVNLATDVLDASVGGSENRPGGDFWRVSLPELVADQPLDRQLLCKATVDKESNVSFPFTNAGEAFSTSRSVDCRLEVNGPLYPRRLPAADPDAAPGPPDHAYDAVFLDVLPENCASANEVTRSRHGFEVVLTILARCSTRPPVLTEERIRADDPALGTAAPDDLWRFAVDGWEQWPDRAELTSPVARARLAFDPAGSCHANGCTVVVDGSAPRDLIASVGGVPVPVSAGADGGLRIRVPAHAAPVGAEPAVWVTLARRSGAVLGMRMTGLSLTKGYR